MTVIRRKISFDGNEIMRPVEMEIKREYVYGSEYTTLLGETRADLVAWKYADTVLKWDSLPQDQLMKLFDITGETVMKFYDQNDVETTEKIMPISNVSTTTRITKNGHPIWKNVQLEVKFINVHKITD